MPRNPVLQLTWYNIVFCILWDLLILCPDSIVNKTNLWNGALRWLRDTKHKILIWGSAFLFPRRTIFTKWCFICKIVPFYGSTTKREYLIYKKLYMCTAYRLFISPHIVIFGIHRFDVLASSRLFRWITLSVVFFSISVTSRTIAPSGYSRPVVWY